MSILEEFVEDQNDSIPLGSMSCPVCGVTRNDVRHCDDPFCTMYAVNQAAMHGIGLCPGAPAPAIVNNLPRTVGQNAETCATFLRSADAVARPDGGMNTAKKGVKYLLKEKPAVLLRNLNAQRAAVGIKPYPRKHFYRLVGVRCVVCVCVLGRGLSGVCVCGRELRSGRCPHNTRSAVPIMMPTLPALLLT